MAKRNTNSKAKKKFKKSNDTKKYTSSKEGYTKDDASDVKVKDQDGKSWNDAKWYIPDDKIRDQVGTYAVNTVTGIPQKIEAISGELPLWNVVGDIEYGSVMEIKLFPNPGTGALTNYGNGVSALDTACRKLYTAISSVNSKTTQYTPESLGIAIIALGELVSLISFATRLYGVAFTYNPRNRNVPSKIIQAMGISDSLLDDLAYYRMQLNKLITAANNVRMIKDLKYFTKCWEIYANYYEDTSSGLAQYYVMRPAGYLQYNELTPTSGELEWVDFGASPISYSTLINHIQNCLNRLLTSSLMNYVYTDIVNYVLKEGGELLGFSYVGELYSLLPIQDTTFLTQVHNMTWGMFSLTGYKIYEDPNTLTIKTTDIYYDPGDSESRMATAHDCIIDFPFTDNPSVDEKIDAVMYTTIVWDIDANGKPLNIANPDHPVLGVYVHTNDGTVVTLPSVEIVNGNTFNALQMYDIAVRPFSIAPLLYTHYYDVNVPSITFSVLGDLNYFTTFKFKQLKNIFDFSFLGLFDAEVKNIKPY